MAEGFDHEVLLKIGFLNLWKENQVQRLDDYKKAFDIVLVNDDSFDFLLELTQELCNSKE